ncbi:MAG: PqqD family protein [Syntrophomonadaceae bacterium]
MKISQGFQLMDIAGQHIIVPLGAKNVNFNKMISLNNSGVFLWRQLQTENTEAELLEAMLNVYDVDEETAVQDIKSFIKKLIETGIIE